MARRPEPITDAYGMGRISDLRDPNYSGKLHLAHVPFVDGCYDQGGVYWGAPANLYVAWGYDDEGYRVDYFVRADSREQAKAHIQREFPKARFYR